MKNKNLILALVLSVVCSIPVVAQTSVSIPDTTVFISDTLLLPVYLTVDNELDLFGLKAEFSYDPTKFELLGYSQTGSISDSILTVVNNDTEGEVLLSIASVFPIKDSGVLIYFSLKTVGGISSHFQLNELRFNEEEAYDPGVYGILEIINFPDLEPNDSFENAIEIEQEKITRTTLSSLEDIDYFKFEAVQGQFLIIEMFGVSGDFDLVLSLYNADQDEIIKVDAYASGGTEFLVFGAPYSGEYTLKVENDNVVLKANQNFNETKELQSNKKDQSSDVKLKNSHFEYQILITETLPEAPLSVTSTSGFKNVVPIVWGRTSSFAYLSVQYYNVYRSTSSSDVFEFIGTSSRRNYVDEDLIPGEKYEYAVSAVYAGDDRESELTFVDTVAIPSEIGFKIESVYYEAPVVIDGVLSPEEWDQAIRVDIDTSNVAYAYIRHTDTHFYLAVVDSLGNDTTRAEIGVYFDANLDYFWDDDEGNYWFTLDKSRDPILDSEIFRSINGTYPDDLVFETLGMVEGSEYSLVSDEDSFVFEGAFSYEESKMNLSLDNTFGLRFYAYAESQLRGWPDGAIYVAQNTFGEVFLPATITSNEGVDDLATRFSLEQNYPNPFNPSTSINFTLPITSEVILNVYNLLGQQVSQVLNEKLTAGSHTVSFDASGLSSGIYLYKIEAGDFVLTKRMTLIK